VRSAYSTNITRHESGTGYSTDTFITVMRTGKGGSLGPVMPWVAFKGLSDDDLAAIHEALGSVQPVAHYIGNAGTPRHCAVCGQDHPLGEFNQLEAPAGLPVEARLLDRLAGQYRSDEANVTLSIRSAGGRLYGRENDDAEIELIPRSDTLFLAPGWVAPIEFVLGRDGRVKQLNSLEIEPLPFERIP
jgi:hypothetical protein